MAAWCELRDDFRNFRLDRVRTAEPGQERFEHEDPVTLDAFVAARQADADSRR